MNDLDKVAHAICSASAYSPRAQARAAVEALKGSLAPSMTFRIAGPAGETWDQALDMILAEKA
jgi:hypothetical protein